MQIKNFPSGIPTGEDYFLFQSKSDNTFRSSTLDLLLGGSGGGSEWKMITTTTTLQPNSKTVINSSTDITVVLPSTLGELGEIELYQVSTGKVLLQNIRFNGQLMSEAVVVFSNKYARFLYINNTIGWIPIVGSISQQGYGNPYLYIAGTLADQSTYNKTITQLGSAPSLVTGLDGKPALRFNATNQELSISPFLSSESGATLYVVYSPNAINQDNYNIIKTNNIGDYWRFWVDGNGYIGTFLGGRIDGFPSSMPANGNHVISIHSTNGFYQVTQNNVSKGTRSNSFVAGDRFRIATNEMPYRGDISLILVYPYHAVGSAENVAVMTKIKQDYPSLSYTI